MQLLAVGSQCQLPGHLLNLPQLQPCTMAVPQQGPAAAVTTLKESQQRCKHTATLLVSICKLRKTWRMMSVFKVGWEEAVATAHGVALMQSVLMSHGCQQDSSSSTNSSTQPPGSADTSSSSFRSGTDVATVAAVVGGCCLLISQADGMCPVAVEQWDGLLTDLAECICGVLIEHMEHGRACSSSNTTQVTCKSRKTTSHVLRLQELQQQVFNAVASKHAALCNSSDADAESQALDSANTANRSSCSSSSGSAAAGVVPVSITEAEVITDDLAKLLQ